MSGNSRGAVWRINGHLMIRVYYLEMSFLIYTIFIRERVKSLSKGANGVYAY